MVDRQPAWLQPSGALDRYDSTTVACRNGLLDVTTRKLSSHSPLFFNTCAVPFDYDPDAPEPAEWLQFLGELWPDDPDSIALLQEWFGYVLSQRTDMHKILLMVGPQRGGKGTIARILTKLFGKEHVAGPTLSSLTTNFGLEPIMDKTLAIVADARLHSQSHQVVERLLSISGEDTLTVDRKYKEALEVRIPARFMLVSNEAPRLSDSSGAMAGRFESLVLTRSWMGKEDRTLEDRLTAELTGILNWALDGLDRLTAQGRFTRPTSAAEMRDTLAKMGSPVRAFVEDMCFLDADRQVRVTDLYSSWRGWCMTHGHMAGSEATFGRDLSSAYPTEVKRTRPTENGRRVYVYEGIGLAGPGY